VPLLNESITFAKTLAVAIAILGGDSHATQTPIVHGLVYGVDLSQ
jgi:hypothetical protein